MKRRKSLPLDREPYTNVWDLDEIARLIIGRYYGVGRWGLPDFVGRSLHACDQKSKRLGIARAFPQRAHGTPWTLEEEEFLIITHREGWEYNHIASLLERTKSMVCAKVKRLKAEGRIPTDKKAGYRKVKENVKDYYTGLRPGRLAIQSRQDSFEPDDDSVCDLRELLRAEGVGD